MKRLKSVFVVMMMAVLLLLPGKKALADGKEQSTYYVAISYSYYDSKKVEDIHFYTKPTKALRLRCGTWTKQIEFFDAGWMKYLDVEHEHHYEYAPYVRDISDTRFEQGEPMVLESFPVPEGFEAVNDPPLIKYKSDVDKFNSTQIHFEILLKKAGESVPGTSASAEPSSPSSPGYGLVSSGTADQVGAAFTKSGSKYQITKISGKNGEVKLTLGAAGKQTVMIPSTITRKGITYKVTAIAHNSFYGNKKIKKAVIGKNVKRIGKRAFRYCSNLKTIEIKSKVLTKAEKKCFKGIHKKAVIKVPSSCLKKYKKLFKGKGQANTVKVKK